MARKKGFNLNQFLKKRRRQVTVIVCCLIIIAGSVIWFVTDHGQKRTIADLEQKLYAVTLDVSPGPSRLSADSLSTENGSVVVRLDNSFASVIGDAGPMQPWLGEGVVIVLEHTQDVRLGDVIFYERGGYRVLQRIVGEQDGQWIIKSDRELEAQLIDKAAVMGRLIAVFY
jgi:hypothetical protein